jgi:hypothetical protein
MITAIPPKDVSPQRLFRLLIQRPRPALEVDHRASFAPNVPLRVVALTAAEYGTAIDVAEAFSFDMMRWRSSMAALVQASLYVGQERAFQSVEAVGELMDEHVEELVGIVTSALAIIGPQYAGSNVDAWDKVLRKGAEHVSNLSTTMVLGGCVGQHGEEPERFFGCPLSQLTDGQLMAYRAANKVANKFRSS